MNQGRNRTYLPPAHSDLSAWPAPDPNVLSEVERSKYFLKREAIEMYAAGESTPFIKERTGKDAEEVRRLITRCLRSDGYGRIYGFTALISGIRTNNYIRTKTVSHVPGSGPGGCAGAMNQLLERFPDLPIFIEEMLFKRASRDIVHESRIPYVQLHKAFIKKIRSYGLTDHDWPFNTANRGYKSLSEYCKRLREQNHGRWIRARVGEEAARRSSVGQGHQTLIPVFRPFSHVQLDFHKIDAASVIILENEFGGQLTIPLSRWHIGLLADERSHAILGVCIALELNPSGDSVLEVVESALRPTLDVDEKLPNAFMVNGRVLPNQLFSQLAYHGFSAIKMDNAWSNSATGVVNNLIDVLGCAVNFGPVRAWWRRPLIERIFKELTGKGLQRLPSTYGTGISDTKNDGANQKAVEFRIMLSELTRIIFRCVEEYNQTPSEGLQFSFPLGVLKAALEHPQSGFLVQPLCAEVKADMRLMQQVVECTIRGTLNRNIHPYVQIDRCNYTNPRLANSYHLIGKKLIVYLDRRDVRIARGTVKETGEEIGMLEPDKNWSKRAVSIRERKLINRSGMALKSAHEGADPVQEWGQNKQQELFTQRKAKGSAKKSSKEALQLTKFAASFSEEPEQTEVLPVQKIPVDRPSDPFGLNHVPLISSVRREG